MKGNFKQKLVIKKIIDGQGCPSNLTPDRVQARRHQPLQPLVQGD